MSYEAFIAAKGATTAFPGIDGVTIDPRLFDHQAALVRWALRRGRAAIFADTGLGKTLMEIEWATHVAKFGRVLILAPLAVAEQTVREAHRFGHPDVRYLREDDASVQIVVANYEMLPHFNPAAFVGVILDESGILKSYTGSTRTALIESFAATPYRLACTATPAPNDFTELGNHSEFLGVRSRVEMLAEFFVHDGGATQDWRIKGHAITPFWKWVASWGAVVKRPSDLGFDDTRGLKLWSNPGDVVLSPFGGIASEGVVAIEEGRKFVGAELKQSYYEQAARNLAEAVKVDQSATLFGAAK